MSGSEEADAAPMVAGVAKAAGAVAARLRDPCDSVAEFWRPRLSAALSGIGILALVGFSVGLCLWELWSGGDLLDFVASNGPSYKRGVGATLVAMVGAGAVLTIAVVLLAKKRLLCGPILEQLGRRLAPLALAPLLPLLFHWRFWQGSREVTFLLLALVLVVSAQKLLQVSLATPPVFGRPRFVDRLLGDGAALRRSCTKFLPFVLVLVAAAGYATFFAYHTIVHHRNVLSSSLDLGLEENVIWHALHSGALFRSTPYGGPTGNLVGEHAAYLSYLIAPIYGIRQSAETLLILQAVLIGGAAIPLYLVARRYLGPWLSCLVAVWYIFYPPLHGSNLYDFHYPPLAPFFLWFTFYFVLARRNVLAVIFAILTLSVREDVSVGLAILGVLLVLTERRTRAGLFLAAAGVAYFVTMKLVIMPLQRGGHEAFIHQYAGLVPEGSHGFGGVMKTVLGNPAFTLGVLLERDKLIYLLQIFLPLAFFPLRRAVGLLCSVPGFLFTLLSTGYRPLYQISFQYTAHWTAYVFIATIVNLAWLGRQASRRGRPGVAWRRAWIAAISLGMLVTSYQFGALLQHNATRGGFGTYHFGTNAEDWERRRNVHELVAMVPRKAKIVASENLVPQVSNRAFAYTLRMGIADADYLLFSLPVSGDERAKVMEVLPQGTFGVVAERGIFVLAKRSQSTELNSGVLSKL